MKAIKKVIYSSFFTLLTPCPNNSKDLLNFPNFRILDILNNLNTRTNLPSKPMILPKKNGSMDKRSMIPKNERL